MIWDLETFARWVLVPAAIGAGTVFAAVAAISWTIHKLQDYIDDQVTSSADQSEETR